MTTYNISLDDLREHLDDHSVSVGSILVGARITMGKSIQDVFNELRIPAHTIAEFETDNFTDMERKPYFIGYIRSYAKYLGIDPEALLTIYHERGLFNVPASSRQDLALATQATTARPASGLSAGGLGQKTRRHSYGFDMRSALSASALIVPGLLIVMVVAAGAYGGMRLLGSFQGLTVVPTDAQPAIGETPIETASNPVGNSSGFQIPEIDYEQLYERQALQAPVVEPRVGRIADLTPRGVLSPATTNINPAAPPASSRLGAPIETAALSNDTETAAPSDPVVSVGPAVPQVELLPLDEAWVSISDENGNVINERLLKPGQTLEIPFDGIIPVLRRAGNANLLYVRVNGTVYGPVGLNGETVVSNIALTPQALDTVYDPVAEDVLAPLNAAESAYLAKLEPAAGN